MENSVTTAIDCPSFIDLRALAQSAPAGGSDPFGADSERLPLRVGPCTVSVVSLPSGSGDCEGLDADTWVLAEQGGGAWQRRPDGTQWRLKVATAPGLADLVGHVSMTFLPAESKPRVLANLAKVRVAANYRVAGHDYRTFATGFSHFVVFNKLMPWDHLGGCLISAEAGGYVARFDGSPYLPSHRDGGLLIASDRDTWNLLRAEVFTL